ncbi:MAG: WecB/TagA/CpsF family glycosyltransferase [Pirellulaceae bacterium]|nr:WecB/TagA/CpsF family glycosyltransferase [Pirellulaceae bacterium]
MTFSTIQTEFSSNSSDFPIGFSAVPQVIPVVVAPKQKPTVRQLPSLPTLASSRVWGIDFSIVNMAQALDYIDAIIQRREPQYAITANANYAMLCEDSSRLADFTHRSKLVLCDGMPILWRSRLNEQALPERVAGADLIFSLAERSAARGHRIFLMGGSEGVALEAASRLKEIYPNVKIVGAECPPFRRTTVAEHERLCQRIRDAKPDILLVAFGQPKGEFWIDENYQDLGVPLSIQLGASFDFITGKAKRAPVWMQKFGLEWLYRTLRDPRRLLPRYSKNAWFLCKTIRNEILEATQ